MTRTSESRQSLTSKDGSVLPWAPGLLWVTAGSFPLTPAPISSHPHPFPPIPIHFLPPVPTSSHVHTLPPTCTPFPPTCPTSSQPSPFPPAHAHILPPALTSSHLHPFSSHLHPHPPTCAHFLPPAPTSSHARPLPPTCTPFPSTCTHILPPAPISSTRAHILPPAPTSSRPHPLPLPPPACPLGARTARLPSFSVDVTAGVPTSSGFRGPSKRGRVGQMGGLSPDARCLSVQGSRPTRLHPEMPDCGCGLQRGKQSARPTALLRAVCSVGPRSRGRANPPLLHGTGFFWAAALAQTPGRTGAF